MRCGECQKTKYLRCLQISHTPHQVLLSFKYSTTTSSYSPACSASNTQQHLDCTPAFQQQTTRASYSTSLEIFAGAKKMDSHQADEYSAPTTNQADLPSSYSYPVPTMSQTHLQGTPDPYLTMPVDTEDPAISTPALLRRQVDV